MSCAKSTMTSATELATLQHKLAEYRDCGVRLGWLIDPQEKRVEIYRVDCPTEYLSQPEQLSGEEVLPGFMLMMAEIWG